MQSWIHVLEWRATVRPGLPALIDDRGARLGYRELLETVERRAGGWTGLGVRPGEVVAIIAKNSADFFVHAFAAMRAGMLPALVNWRLSAAELTDLFGLLQPVAVAADAEFAALVETAAPELGRRVVIGGGEVRDGWLDGSALDAAPPPAPSCPVPRRWRSCIRAARPGVPRPSRCGTGR